jgi:hypothetical protein
MAQLELIKELKLREGELKAKIEDINAELDAIRTLIGVYRSNTTDGENMVRTKYPSKSKSTNWQDYALTLLSILGEAKASAVADLAIEANPDIPNPETIRNAISSKLSKLQIAGVIDAEKGVNKKDGFTYKVKKSL